MRLTCFALPSALVLVTILACLQNTEGATKGIAKYVIGGRNAGKGQFPWHALLFFKRETGNVAICGGAVISRRAILTAAHCYHGSLPVRAYLGGICFNGNDAEMVISHFKEFITHELPASQDVQDKDLPNDDIAILTLPTRLQWTDNLKPIKLPRQSQGQLPGGTDILASGFGATTEPESAGGAKSSPASRLHYIKFKLRHDRYCIKVLSLCSRPYSDRGMYHGDSGGPWVWKEPLIIQLFPAKGDSGGPWVWKDPSGVYRLVGVNVGGDGAPSEGQGQVNVAVDVHQYLDWIKNKTGIVLEA